VWLLTGWLVLAGLAIAAACLPLDRPLSLRPRLVFRLGMWRWPAAVAVGLAVLLLAGVPLGSLCYKAGLLVTQTDAGRIRFWSPGQCLATIALAPVEFRREFGWSLLIAGLAASAAVLAATVLAWVARRRAFWSGALAVLTAVCLVVPGPVIGLGVIWLLNRRECPWLADLYDRSILAPWLAMSLRAFPPAVLVMWHALRSVPEEMLNAAALDGAGPAARLGRIVLPSRLAALGLAWLVAFAVAMADLAASILVVPPGVVTLPIQIFGLLHYGVEDQVAGICLAQVLLFALAAAAVLALAGWWSREARRRQEPIP